jgi:hypothetical protein
VKNGVSCILVVVHGTTMLESDIWFGWTDAFKAQCKIPRHEIMNQPAHGKFYSANYLHWRILTNKEIYEIVKKPTITETIRLNRLWWFGHIQRMEGKKFPKGYCI